MMEAIQAKELSGVIQLNCSPFPHTCNMSFQFLSTKDTVSTVYGLVFWGIHVWTKTNYSAACLLSFLQASAGEKYIWHFLPDSVSAMLSPTGGLLILLDHKYLTM